MSALPDRTFSAGFQHLATRKPHFSKLVNESVSRLTPFSALIITICFVILFCFRLYFFEKFLMNTRLYKSKYRILAEDQRRSFVNHHMAGCCKFILLCSAAYPFFAISFGKATVWTRWSSHSSATLGDVLVVCSQLFVAMYVFELFYRTNVSYISAAHHIGAIMIAQSGVAITSNHDSQVDAIYEFMLCMLWGAFDVLSELWPHCAMILYRLVPDNHEFLSRIFTATVFLELFGTTLETAIVFWLWGSVWDKWTLSFKIATPILHVLFSIAQLWGARVMWQLSRKEKQKARQYSKHSDASSIEDGPSEAETKLMPTVVLTRPSLGRSQSSFGGQSELAAEEPGVEAKLMTMVLTRPLLGRSQSSFGAQSESTLGAN